MATAKRKHRVDTLGSTAADVYVLAEQILKIRDWFNDPADISPLLEPVLRAARVRFEELLVQEPARAVHEHLEWVKSPWRTTSGKALRDERLAQAVLGFKAVFEGATDAGVGEYIALAALKELGARTISTVELAKIARSETIRLAREEGGGFSNGGPQAAAIALVSRATGLGEQTVKRAVLELRKRSRRATH